MERWSGSIAIVTGCTSGIGLAIAKQLIKHNVKVVGLARRVDTLKSLETEFPEKFYGKECDLNNIEDILSAFKYVENNLGLASILVNNAGLLVPMSILDVEEEAITKMLQVNVRGPIICSREAVKRMIAKNIDGHVINVGSTCSFLNEPTEGISPFGIYTATKFAVAAFSEDLRRELYERNTKIKVSVLNPGYVNTEMILPLKDKCDDMKILEPEDVAKLCINILETPPYALVTSLDVKPLAQKY